MTITKTRDLVTYISNQLGWAPPLGDTRPAWKVASTETAKLSRAMAKNPKMFTFDNLILATEYMRKEKIVPRSPMAVVYYVGPALHAASAVEKRPLGELIDDAIGTEYELKHPGWRDWVSRLTNAFGPYRQEVYDSWRTERQP